MKLEDLLDELRSGILNDTSRETTHADYLWSDVRLKRYINEAQRRFAVQGLVIRDATTAECCDVALVEGQTQYTLHQAVIAVVSAKLEDATADLPRTGHSVLGAYRPPSEDWVDTSGLPTMMPGRPLVWSTDEGLSSRLEDATSQVLLRLYPAPDEDMDGTLLKLRVVRKPLDILRVDGDEPEVPEDHQIEMLDWAAYLALRVVDDDMGAPKRAAEFAASFEAHVKAARQTAMRKMFAPTPWGFGKGGWAWES